MREEMRRFLMTSVLALSAMTVIAKVWTPTTIPIVHLEDSTRYVCDPENILLPETTFAIDSIFRALQDSTGIQTLVAVVSDIEPDDCFEFAHELGETAGVGLSGKDNGLVILLSTGERCIQFATGYGIEGILPDAICRRIQEKYMNPYFKDNEWSSGMLMGVKAIDDYMRKQDLPGNDEDNLTNKIGLGVLVLLLVFFPVLLIVFGIWLAVRKKWCPKCRKFKMKRISRVKVSETSDSIKYMATYRCSICGHEIVRNETEYKSSGGSSYGGGGHSYTGRGFSTGGGGFSGGHYGGGHFGGGGAGSRF